jgi:hypothetical protein
VSRRNDVEVVGRAVILVVLSTSQEFLVVHDPEICSLDGVVGIKGVRDPVLTIVVNTSSYLDFISYVVELASLSTIGLDQRRLSSYVVSWVRSNICLNIGSIGYVVGNITSGIGRVVCWGISCRVGWGVGCSIGSGVDRLRYFIFASSLFSYRVEGTLSTTSLARTLRSAFAYGVGTCCGSAVSRTSFFDLSGCNADVGLEAPDHWRIFKVISGGESGSQVGLQ